MRYRTFVHIAVPGTTPAIFVGGLFELTESERDAIGKEMARAENGSITLGDGTELALPAGIYQHVYFRLVPEADSGNEAAS